MLFDEGVAGQQDVPLWATPAEEALTRLRSCPDGLSGDEARRRLEAVGPNALPAAEPTPWWRRAAAQFQDTLIYILLASALAKALLRDWVDFAVILGVAVVNAAIGLVQEGRAERALAAIRSMLSVQADVLRDGRWRRVEAAELVPGDVARLRAGDRVPADLRLIQAASLEAEESALTGESVASAKDVEPVEPGAALGDRGNLVFSGTLITSGSGLGVVTATGRDTEVGRIQALVEQVEATTTPLSRQLDRFGRALAWLILAMAVVMVAIGRFAHSWSLPDLVSAAIGFAVAAVPEGLPALVTIILALGVQQMARQRAIVRRLPAVEALGSVTTICSDKTGTLTRNEMTVREIVTRVAAYQVEGVGYAPEGGVRRAGAVVRAGECDDLDALVRAVARCNDAVVHQGEGRWTLVGVPTDGALRTLALKQGADDATEAERLDVVPFDSGSKYMATLDRHPDGATWLSVKGAPDRILDRCACQRAADGSAEPLERGWWEERIDALGGEGLRVLAAAVKPGAGTDEIAAGDLELGLELLGLVGIADPPRPEAVAAIATAQRAGIKVKMITGDHLGTALAIAREMGLVHDHEAHALSGHQLEAMSDEELLAVVRDVEVFARTSPEHKIRIVTALQQHGEVVAMTGDGVNDAPALTQADVGVAMGIKGTEVTKEAADVVLADDNFATIERAVEEGRRIYDNVRKSVLFLLPTNGAQALVVLVAVVFGFTLPLEPVQVLWINMVTAVTLSLSLAHEGAEPGLMERPPRRSDGSVLDLAYAWRVLVVSMLVGAATLLVFMVAREAGASIEESRTTAVTMLALGQSAYLFNSRFNDASSLTWRVLVGNRAIWISVAAMMVSQVGFVYLPFMHAWFESAAIGARAWGLCAALAVAVFVLVEAGKAVDRRLGLHEPGSARPHVRPG